MRGTPRARSATCCASSRRTISGGSESNLSDVRALTRPLDWVHERDSSSRRLRVDPRRPGGGDEGAHRAPCLLGNSSFPDSPGWMCVRREPNPRDRGGRQTHPNEELHPSQTADGFGRRRPSRRCAPWTTSFRFEPRCRRGLGEGLRDLAPRRWRTSGCRAPGSWRGWSVGRFGRLEDGLIDGPHRGLRPWRGCSAFLLR
jgi:hypothetical protein